MRAFKGTDWGVPMVRWFNEVSLNCNPLAGPYVSVGISLSFMGWRTFVNLENLDFPDNYNLGGTCVLPDGRSRRNGNLSRPGDYVFWVDFIREIPIGLGFNISLYRRQCSRIPRPKQATGFPVFEAVEYQDGNPYAGSSKREAVEAVFFTSSRSCFFVFFGLFVSSMAP